MTAKTKVAPQQEEDLHLATGCLISQAQEHLSGKHPLTMASKAPKRREEHPA